ncbi:DNA-formamidopyrimidine glycosylase family protein [Halpernia sp.]|uniref:DNA-formamidopyrimidine glycosylase family protein n=1 Tax=Halpernia sp. TaxID=2782209 RepID=UPI003A8E871C
MPEGPTIKFLAQKLQKFVGEKVTEASGYGEMDKSKIDNIKLENIETFGKNLIFLFKDFFVTAHFGLFGSMKINERKKVNASFALHFTNDEINFYVTRTKLYEGKPQDYFNFKTDILKPEFDQKLILETLQNKFSKKMIGDVLMDQSIFTGVGNIIRVEVLYRSKIHPESIVEKIPVKKLKELIKITAYYAEEFLILMTNDCVKKDAIVYAKKVCPIHKTDLEIEKMGKVKRTTYWCKKCQKLYN